jgi:opacity protein-like surface antigen
MRSLLCAALLASVLSAPSQAEDVSGLLHRLTQTFSDAGQEGRGSVMAKYLDDDVIFFNERGDRATKSDMSQDGPPARGVNRAITTTDWNCKVHGNVAVTSFVDVVEEGPADRREQYRYRSVETWLKEKGGWKMIGSETLALQEDPPAIALDQATLQEYVGAYEASPGIGITFTRQGDRLFASVNGGSGIAQEAQARDILFSPGHGATPKVFQRDGNGKITGFIYLRGNHSLTFRRKAA